MTEQPASAIGTVAQEAARLIEDMAAMARSGTSQRDDPRPYAGEPAQEPASPDRPDAADAAGAGVGEAGDHETGERPAGEHTAGSHGATDAPSAGVCSQCGAEVDGTPASCRICPLCRGIALLRSVRPETVDLLADLAMSLAASLRDVAMRSRASDQASSARTASGGPADGDRAPVQDIQVDDESEG
jgi:hypothetical protein